MEDLDTITEIMMRIHPGYQMATLRDLGLLTIVIRGMDLLQPVTTYRDPTLSLRPEDMPCGIIGARHWRLQSGNGIERCSTVVWGPRPLRGGDEMDTGPTAYTILC
jgi:hypothetical protein